MSKKLVQVNTVCNGSTGKIMLAIQKKAEEEGYEVYNFFGRGNSLNEKCIRIDSKFEILWHVCMARLFNLQGHSSIFATYRMIKKIKKINPDVIHLHNIHGYYINYKMLLNFIHKQNIPVVWTLHDCWAFTGHCTHYTINDCNKWKTICSKCKYKKLYPKAYFFGNRTKKEYLTKKKLINKLNNLTLTVPSEWLKKQVKMSFLKNKQIEIVHNCINTDIFKSTLDLKIKERYKIPENLKIILGVAPAWSESKGMNYFIELSKIIDEKKEIIVMVGLTEKQIQELPKNIVGIKRTENIEELVKLYSVADVFFNPSMQETFSMVTLEAMACGTPCVVLNSTATPELISDETGEIIDDYDINKIYNKIEEIIDKDIKAEVCEKHAKKYDIENYIQYLNIYEKLLNDRH